VSINPFGETGSLFVLVDDDEQYSLWLTLTDGPASWRVLHSEADRAECLDYIEQNWTDIRAESVRDTLAAARAFDS
jgi:uncharacterized protein YbdZ (MbtH family)